MQTENDWDSFDFDIDMKNIYLVDTHITGCKSVMCRSDCVFFSFDERFFVSTLSAAAVNRWKLSFYEALRLHADFLPQILYLYINELHMHTPQCQRTDEFFLFDGNHIYFLNDFKIGFFFSTHHHEYGHNE